MEEVYNGGEIVANMGDCLKRGVRMDHEDGEDTLHFMNKLGNHTPLIEQLPLIRQDREQADSGC